MALKVFEGFDHYGGRSDILARQGLLQWTEMIDLRLITGRNGYGFALGGSNTELIGVLSSNFTTFFLGFAKQFIETNFIIDYVSIMDMSVGSNGTPQYTVTLNQTSGVIAARLGGSTGTVLGQTAPNAFAPSAYNYFEIGGLLDGSAGTITVKVNGTAKLTLTGLDNLSTSNAYMNGITFNSTGGSADGTSLDDIYFNDSTTGPGTNPCNTFIGDVSCDTLFATSNGSVSWTPLANTNYQEINETQFDGDTSYNSTAAASNVDLFNFGSLRSSAFAVLGVQVTAAYRKDDSGSRTVQQRIVSSGTTADGTTGSIPSSYVYLTDLFTVDPNTSASWAVSAVNAVQAGYELVS